jgi:hypothetical protein
VQELQVTPFDDNFLQRHQGGLMDVGLVVNDQYSPDLRIRAGYGRIFINKCQQIIIGR